MSPFIRLAFAALVIRLAVAPVAAQGINHGAASTLPPAEQAAIERVIELWVANHPDAIRHALDAVAAPAVPQDAADPLDGVIGNRDARTTVIAFIDRDSPESRSMMPVLAAAVATDPDLRVVVKELPLLSANSVRLAAAAAAVRRQGDAAARKLEAALMAEPGTPDEAAVARAVALAHVDTARFASDRADPAIRDYLRRTRAFADSIAVSATPVLLVGDAVLLGVVTIADLRAAVSDARKAAP